MLPFKNRLKKEKDFQRVFNEGRFAASDLISVKFVGNGTDDTRVGFVVSNKVAKKAVLRNRTKRMLRGVIGGKMNLIAAGFDIIVIAKKGISDVGYEKIADETEKILKKSGLLQ